MGKRKLFFKNALVLTAATLLLRLLGMAFRIVISNRLGAEGMGLYQIVLSVYMLASTLASSGLSLGVTRLVSEEQIRASQKSLRRLMRVCLTVSVVMGLAAGAALYFSAGLLARYWVGEPEATASLRVLSLALPFMAVSASLRGYYTARRDVTFTSVSQLLEQGIKIGACLGLMAAFGVTGATFGCFLVMAADTLSEWFSFGFQYIGYRVDVRRLPTAGAELPKKPGVLRRLAEIVLPVAGVRLIGSALYTVENTLVPGFLETFLSGTTASPRAAALAQWGQLKGMGIPVLMFPSTLLASFVLLLVPELSEYRARGENRQANRLIGLSLHVTLALSIGIAALFYLLADEVCELVYPGQGITFYLRVLSPIVPFIYLENVTEGMLKGLGEQKITLRYSLINVAVRLVFIFLLVPKLGMRGFLWMMILDNIVTSLLHSTRVLEVTKLRVRWGNWVVKPMACAAVCFFVGWRLRAALLAAGVGRLPVLLAVGLAAGLLYLGGLLLSRSFTLEDLRALAGRKKKGASPAAAEKAPETTGNTQGSMV